MITKHICGSRDTEQFFWQWHFFLVCMWFCQLSMYLQTTDTAGTIESVSQWPREPTTCWLPETDDYDERILMTDSFFMQQNLKQRRTHPSSVSLWRTNTNDERHLRQQNISYYFRGRKLRRNWVTIKSSQSKEIVSRNESGIYYVLIIPIPDPFPQDMKSHLLWFWSNDSDSSQFNSLNVCVQ